MTFVDVAPFPGLVTEDGRKLLLDYPADFRAHYAPMAGSGVLLYLVKQGAPINPKARAYYFAEIVKAYSEEIGEPSVMVAHGLLKRYLLCTPETEPPSISNFTTDGRVLSDLIARASAHLAVDYDRQIYAPEPDPVRRFLRGKGRAA